MTLRRIRVAPRPNWEETAARIGYDYVRNADGSHAWREDACYVFSLADIARLRRAAETLHGLCLALVDEAVRTPGGLDAYHIPAPMQPVVRDSWRCRDPFLIGRFDFAWCGGAPKLIEYNADTPATLPESTRMQSLWRSEVAPHRGQMPLDERAIVARLAHLRATGRLDGVVHVVPYPDNREDLAHARYYADWLARAGLEAVSCPLRDLEISTHGRLLHRGRIVRAMIRMYPWELMFRDPGARHLRGCDCAFLNPPWTALLSNKALLPELWRRHPDHPLLLRAATSPAGMTAYAEKPIHGRGGENVRLVRHGADMAARAGTYGAYPRIYQALADQRVDGVTASVGAWIVGDAFAGVTIRESPDDIIHHASPIVPHCVTRAPGADSLRAAGRWFRRRKSGLS